VKGHVAPAAARGPVALQGGSRFVKKQFRQERGSGQRSQGSGFAGAVDLAVAAL